MSLVICNYFQFITLIIITSSKLPKYKVCNLILKASLLQQKELVSLPHCTRMTAYLKHCLVIHGASQVALLVKNLLADTGDIRDAGSVPGSGRSPGGGHGNPLLYSCLESPADKGTWWATANGSTESWTLLKRLRTHACSSTTYNTLKNTEEKQNV